MVFLQREIPLLPSLHNRGTAKIAHPRDTSCSTRNGQLFPSVFLRDSRSLPLYQNPFLKLGYQLFSEKQLERWAHFLLLASLVLRYKSQSSTTCPSFT